MPGLYDTSSWAQLPLEASCVNACANGFSLGLSAQLTYMNPCSDTVQGGIISVNFKVKIVLQHKLTPCYFLLIQCCGNILIYYEAAQIPGAS